MTELCHIFVLIFVLLEVSGQNQIDSPCTVKSSGAPGVCKLLSDCGSVRAEVILLILPQVCGFQGTQSIVCCPKERQPGGTSKQKCREYSQFASKNPAWISGTNSKCGHKIVKRIVGGVPTSRTEFAHMAIIGFPANPGGEIMWLGGGTLISDRYVLTSATSTITPDLGEAKYVKLGITSLSDKGQNDGQKQEFKIAELIIHPDFKPSAVYNDIGLIKLAKAVTLHSHARPACLYTENNVSEKKAIATGWGYTSFAGLPSDQLLKANLELVTYEACNESYKNSVNRRMRHGIDRDTHICAGSEGRDTCQGDSGGPLQIYHTGDDTECMYDIIGITSLGRGCGHNIPGVYTRVSYYVKWIEDIVWPESTNTEFVFS